MRTTTTVTIRSRSTSRRDQVAATVFSTWVVVGLFVDGWAHNADKPETFWTPWHAVLYSGFLAGMAWSAASELRDRRRGVSEPADPLVLAGFGLFAAGGLADMAWHTLFGVEVNVEALLSPSHLLLMVAGLLLVTSPVREVLADRDPAPSLGAFVPAGVGITLTVAVVAFFLQFASALGVVEPEVYRGDASDLAQIHGIVGVLVSNLLLLGALLWTLRHWVRPPDGTFTFVFGGTALLMAGLEAFDHAALVLPVLIAGLVADALVAMGQRLPVVATVVPVVLWGGWFATYHGVWTLGWSVELWAGTIVLASLTGVGLSLLAGPVAERDTVTGRT